MILEHASTKKKMSFSEIMDRQAKRNWDAIMRFHPKQVLSFESYSIDKTFKGAANEKTERIHLHIGKVIFTYTTNRGVSKSDTRIFILNYKPTEEDIRKEFSEWINNYNDSHNYRPLLNHKIEEIYLSSIGDIKILKEINNLKEKDKKRIVVNRTKNNYITIRKYIVEYTTDRNKRRKGEFLIPFAHMFPGNTVWSIEVKDMINFNRQRKVSNAKILDSQSMSLIRL